MENVTEKMKQESIKSIQSTIRKSEKALAQMTEKGANTTLIRKRLNALRVGLAVIENVDGSVKQEDLVEAREVLVGLLPSIEGVFAKAKPGSPQKTLLERRIKALELAVQGIGQVLEVRS